MLSDDVHRVEHLIAEVESQGGHLHFEALGGLLESLSAWRLQTLQLELTVEALIEENRALREALRRAKGEEPQPLADNVIHADFGNRPRPAPPGGAA